VGGHEGQTNEYNRAGVQDNRPKRKGTTDQKEKVILLGGRSACMELYPNLPLIGEVQHCSTPPTPKRSNTKGRKKWFGEGLVREIQKRKAYPFFF